MEKELLTVKEVSEVLMVNVQYVYKLINSGMLPAIKVGRLKVRAKALHDLIDRMEGYDITDPNNVVMLGRDGE